VRLFDADFASKARHAFGLDAAMSASLRAAPVFAAAALEEGVLTAFVLDDSRLVIVRAASAGPWAGWPLSRVPERVLLRGRSPSGPFFPVGGDEVLGEEETVVLASSRPLVLGDA
jgi:hypothetical protein